MKELAKVFVDQANCTFVCVVTEYNCGWNANELRVLFRHPKRQVVDQFCESYNREK